MKVALALIENFEIVEAMTPIDMLRRAGIKIDTISIFNQEYVKSAVNVFVKVDKKFDEINLNEYDMLILPGGPGTAKYNESKKFLDEIIKFNKNGKNIAAICAAPSILSNLGILKKGTCFPSFAEKLINDKTEYINESVVIDNNIITGRAAASSIEFSLQLVELLKGKEAREKVEKAIVLCK